jgi:hypothetical protein
MDELIFEFDCRRLSTITFIITIKVSVNRFNFSEEFFYKFMVNFNIEDIKLAEVLYDIVIEQYESKIIFNTCSFLLIKLIERIS